MLLRATAFKTTGALQSWVSEWASYATSFYQIRKSGISEVSEQKYCYHLFTMTEDPGNIFPFVAILWFATRAIMFT